MTFTFRVYYEDDSLLNYGKKRFKMVHEILPELWCKNGRWFR